MNKDLPTQIHNYMSFSPLLSSNNSKDEEICKLKFELLQLKATFDSKKSPALLPSNLYLEKVKYLNDEISKSRT